MKYLSILAFVAMSMSACTVDSIHNNSSLNNINSAREARSVVRTGMSMDQVSAVLGKPSFKNTQNDQTMWTYVNRTTNLRGQKLLDAAFTGYTAPDSKTITVSFNTAGKVRKVDYSEQTF